MRRRVFVSGSLLAAAGAAASFWGVRRSQGAPGTRLTFGAERLPDGRVLVRDAALAFGTTVSIVAVHEDPEIAVEAIDEALARTRRIDSLMTVYRAESQVGRLNATGALPHPDPNLVRVLEFSQRLSSLSDGAFDVTVQPLWTLHVECKRQGRSPSPAEIAKARELVDWSAVEVSSSRITLGRPGMAITLNGVAQGYAADLALAALRERGVHDALIDTGEFGAEGERRPWQPWTIGIQHPRVADAVLATVAMDGRFVATSGDYATTFTDDFAHHHIFDPRTGDSPAGLSSVVVAARSGMEADGLTKPMMVLERSRARALLSRFPGSGAAWIDKSARIADSQDLQLGRG
jgi:thiamine biosynthesis lipoprotein